MFRNAYFEAAFFLFFFCTLTALLLSFFGVFRASLILFANLLRSAYPSLRVFHDHHIQLLPLLHLLPRDQKLLF